MAVRLRRVDPSEPGISRRGRGRGFEYLDPGGEQIDDEETLARIRELAIPPAWREVWISPHPGGHIQATGLDDRGRKQYLYHQRWREQQDRAKFDEMLDFARVLPRVRERISADLGGRRMTRERVLACALRLLDRHSFRVGGEEYAAENDSVGLATLRKDHVTVSDRTITIDYRGKSGKRLVRSFSDPEIHDVMGSLRRRRGGGGPELLAYRGRRGWVDLRSEDINEYVKEVARYLANTPAVARASYIDPRVFDRYDTGVTIEPALGGLVSGDDIGAPGVQPALEAAVIDLIAHPDDSELVGRVAS